MNIVLINHYAGSPEMGMEFRPYYMAREWVKLGHRVIIIAGDYSHLRRKNPSVKADFTKEKIDGINYCWVKTGAYEGNGVKRALSMARFTRKLWLKAKWIAKTFRPDVIITSSTYPIDTYAGQRIRHFASKAKLVHEVHDMWPATLIEVGGMSRFHPFVIVMQIGENSAYHHSDKVVSLLPCALKHMQKHGMTKEKYVHVNNGIVLEDWKNPQELPQEHKQILRQIKDAGKFVVGYFGGHALSNALDDLLDVAQEILSDTKIHFVLVGDGVEKAALEERAQREELSNVTFLPPISKYAVPNLIKYFDCCYVGAKDSPLYRFGIAMNKIFDGMMSGKPLLYAVNAPNDYIKKYHCGVSASPGDKKSIRNAIEQLKQMPQEERNRLGENGRRAVLENFEYSVLAKKFLEALK